MPPASVLRVGRLCDASVDAGVTAPRWNARAYLPWFGPSPCLFAMPRCSGHVCSLASKRRLSCPELQPK
eukprot:4951491-Alexandrium_andersonii.AAC.1